MRSIFPIACVLVLCSFAMSDDWRQFRGADAGKLATIEHPVSWSADSNIAWSIPMKGSGWSSPIVVGDRIFVTSAESESGGKPKGMMAGVASMRSFRNAKPAKHKYVVTCLSLVDGSSIWTKTVSESVPPVIHPSNTYATESPVTDGNRLFTFFATTGTLNAWDLEGNEIWRRELGSFRAGNGFGTGSSLAIFEDRIFVQYDNDESSFVAAYDGETGDEVWRDNDRPKKTSWSTPFIWKNAKQQELITCASGMVKSYSPKTGDVLWRITGMDSGFSGSPAVDSQRIYFGTSGPSSAGPLVAVNAGTEGEVPLDRKFENEKVAWSRTKSGPGMASPVVSNGYLYIPGSGGILSCYDIKTGERSYRTRVKNMSTVAASLWADEQHVFILDENGTTHVIQSGPEFKEIASNELDDLFWSTPAIAGKSLLLRGVEKLYCIRAN